MQANVLSSLAVWYHTVIGLLRWNVETATAAK